MGEVVFNVQAVYLKRLTLDYVVTAVIMPFQHKTVFQIVSESGTSKGSKRQHPGIE